MKRFCRWLRRTLLACRRLNRVPGKSYVRYVPFALLVLCLYAPPPIVWPYPPLTAKTGGFPLYVTGGTVVEQEVVRSTEVYVAVRYAF